LPSVDPAFDRLPPLPFASVRPAFERDELDFARDEPPDFVRDEPDRLALDRLPPEERPLLDEPLRDRLLLDPPPDRLLLDREEPDRLLPLERDEPERLLPPERDELDRERDELDDERDDDERELPFEREELEERLLDDRRREPPFRSDAGISSRATAFASCSICFSRNFAIRSSSRRIDFASFAVSVSPTVSASVSMAV
jgi:hypothetical protein